MILLVWKGCHSKDSSKNLQKHWSKMWTGQWSSASGQLNSGTTLFLMCNCLNISLILFCYISCVDIPIRIFYLQLWNFDISEFIFSPVAEHYAHYVKVAFLGVLGDFVPIKPLIVYLPHPLLTPWHDFFLFQYQQNAVDGSGVPLTREWLISTTSLSRKFGVNASWVSQ